MLKLADVSNNGEYLIIKIDGSLNLKQQLATIGMLEGKKLTVFFKNEVPIFTFQGKQLKINTKLARNLNVMGLDDILKNKLVSLSDLKVNQLAVVRKINGDSILRKRLLDMGMTRNTIVKIIRLAPLSDPIEVKLRGYRLSIRSNEAKNILVNEVK